MIDAGADGTVIIACVFHKEMTGVGGGVRKTWEPATLGYNPVTIRASVCEDKGERRPVRAREFSLFRPTPRKPRKFHASLSRWGPGEGRGEARAPRGAAPW